MMETWIYFVVCGFHIIAGVFLYWKGFRQGWNARIAFERKQKTPFERMPPPAKLTHTQRVTEIINEELAKSDKFQRRQDRLRKAMARDVETFRQIVHGKKEGTEP